ATIAATRSTDPVRMARAAVFTAWENELGLGGGYRTADLIKHAAQTTDLFGNSALRDALLDVAMARGPRRDEIDPRRLAKWLREQTNVIANRFKLTVDLSDQARPRWVLTKVETGS